MAKRKAPCEESMNGDDLVSETLKTLGVKEIAPAVYNDILHPACAELGKNLLVIAKCVTIAMSPLSAAVWGFENIRDWLAVKLTQKLAHIPEARIKTPPISIAGPALLQLTFCKEQHELRELYASLLASSMDSETRDKVHPAFVYVIQQLSPDEALILSWIAKKGVDTTLATETTNKHRWSIKGTEWLEKQFENICHNAGIRRPDLSDAYLENLLRLRLLSLGHYLEVDYISEHGHDYGISEPSVSQEETKELYVTPFGKQFIEVCVKER